jgi:V/A-type H+-transporting ATPase subunit D
MANAVSPTKANLMAAKKSLALAKNGYELLDRKRNILIRETMAFADAAREIQSEIQQVFSDAYKALMLANVTLGDCSKLAQAVPVEQGLSLQTRSVMGVEIPTVTLNATPIHNSYGFASSNSYLDDACYQFARVKELTAKLTQIESSVTRLAAAINKTGKRANALKNIVIPRYEQQIAHMNEVLEEKELEEHSRMKMIKRTKI